MNANPENKVNPTHRIDFGFVLLPEEEISQELTQLAHRFQERVSCLPVAPCGPLLEGYSNRVVGLPHLSVGHYSLLAVELPTLFQIVESVAQKFSVFNEPMRPTFEAKHNITLYAQYTEDKTNSEIIRLYRDLRTAFFHQVATKAPATGGFVQRLWMRDNDQELDHIDRFYQAHGTPEKNRICPHFTLLYSFSAHKDAVDQILLNERTPETLKTIQLPFLGIVPIDAWGNPTGKALYKVKLPSV